MENKRSGEEEEVSSPEVLPTGPWPRGEHEVANGPKTREECFHHELLFEPRGEDGGEEGGSNQLEPENGDDLAFDGDITMEEEPEVNKEEEEEEDIVGPAHHFPATAA